MPSSPTPPDIAQWHVPADVVRWVVLLATAGLISYLFLSMIGSFLIALSLAAIASILADPTYRFLLKLMPGRTGLASGLTLLLALIAVILPLVIIAILAAEQATGLAGSASDAIDFIAADPRNLTLPDWVPFGDVIVKAGPEIAAKAGTIAASIASFLISSLSAITRGTAVLFMNLFVFLYAMFIFQQMEVPVIRQVLSRTGLRSETQDILAERMISVSRATVKGTVVIGLVQGGLGALGFWVAGIDGVAFWGVVMLIASVIPGVGAAAIVVGGAIYLGVQGELTKAIVLAAWGVIAVGMVDNLLRPRLVGKEAQMNDIVILVSTLGGLGLFGAVGLVLGPVVAGLFFAIWTILPEHMAGTGEGLEPDP